MASENETVAEILTELRGIKGGQHTNGGLSYERWRARCQFADDYADRIEASRKREVALHLKATETWIAKANSLRDKLTKKEREVAELRECLKAATEIICDDCETQNCESCVRNMKWRKALEGATDGR